MPSNNKGEKEADEKVNDISMSISNIYPTSLLEEMTTRSNKSGNIVSSELFSINGDDNSEEPGENYRENKIVVETMSEIENISITTQSIILKKTINKDDHLSYSVLDTESKLLISRDIADKKFSRNLTDSYIDFDYDKVDLLPLEKNGPVGTINGILDSKSQGNQTDTLLSPSIDTSLLKNTNVPSSINSVSTINLGSSETSSVFKGMKYITKRTIKINFLKFANGDINLFIIRVKKQVSKGRYLGADISKNCYILSEIINLKIGTYSIYGKINKIGWLEVIEATPVNYKQLIYLIQ